MKIFKEITCEILLVGEKVKKGNFQIQFKNFTPSQFLNANNWKAAKSNVNINYKNTKCLINFPRVTHYFSILLNKIFWSFQSSPTTFIYITSFCEKNILIYNNGTKLTTRITLINSCKYKEMTVIPS